MADVTETQAMGSTNRVQLNGEMQKAIQACADYRAAVNSIVERIRNEYQALSNGFTGKAAMGFNKFYTEVVDKFFTSSETFDKYLQMYDDASNGVFAAVERAFAGTDGLDPELGNQNSQMAAK